MKRFFLAALAALVFLPGLASAQDSETDRLRNLEQIRRLLEHPGITGEQRRELEQLQSELQCPGGICQPGQPVWGRPIWPGSRPPQAPQAPASPAPVPQWIVDASVRVSVQEAGKNGGWMGSGTVFCLDYTQGKAFIVTNHHVVPREHGESIQVKFPSGKTVSAAFIATETEPDLSIIACDVSVATSCVPLADAFPPAGTPVFQVGYPLGNGPVRRKGISRGQAGVVDRRFYAVDFSMDSDHGDSGSGIFQQSDGKLCAILWGGDKPTRSSSAVPVNYLHKMLSDLEAEHVIIGVGVIRQRPGQPAQPVTPVGPGTPVTPVAPAPPVGPPAWKSDVDAVKADVAAVMGRLGKLESGSGQHATLLGKMQADLAALQGGSGQAKTLLGKLQEDLAGVQAGHGDLKTKLDSLAKNIGNVDVAGSVGTLAAGLTKIKTTVDAVAPIVAKVPDIEAKVVTGIAAAAGGPASLVPWLIGVGGLGGVSLLTSLVALKKGGAATQTPPTFPHQ